MTGGLEVVTGKLPLSPHYPGPPMRPLWKTRGITSLSPKDTRRPTRAYKDAVGNEPSRFSVTPFLK